MNPSFRNLELMEPAARRAVPATQRTVIRNAALAENKVPLLHRFFLVDGRIVEGFLYRGPNSRLVDELYGQKGSFVSLIDARCATTGSLTSYMAINERHIVSIEEISHEPELGAARVPSSD